MKKTLSILMAVVMLISMISIATAETTEITWEQILANVPGGIPDLSGVSISLLTRTAQSTEYSYDDILPLYQQMADLTGAKLVWSSTDAEYNNARTTRLLAIDTLPLDIVWIEGTAPNSMRSLIEDEILYDITKAYDVAPNIAKYYNEDSPEVAKTFTYLDGGIYCLPNTRYASSADFARIRVEEQSMTYRSDIAEELGFTDIPLTIDDWYALLSAVKAAYPDMIPFNSNGMYHLAGQNINAFAGAYGIRNNLAVWTDWIVTEDGSVDFQADNPEMLAYITEMNKWYSEGLLGFTAGGGNRDGLLLQNAVFADENCSTWNLLPAIDQLRQIDPDASFAQAPLPTKDGYDMTYMGRDTFMNFWGVVDNGEEQSKAVCKFIDFGFFSEYGKYANSFGVMGPDTWYFDENGEVVISDDLLHTLATDSTYMPKQRGAGGWTTPMQSLYFLPLIEAKQVAWADKGEEWVKAKENAAWATQVQAQYMTAPYHDSFFTEDDQDINSRYYSDMSTYCYETLNAFIIGDRPLTEWDDFCKELVEVYHLDELTEIRNR